jgi:hypothetical protein
MKVTPTETQEKAEAARQERGLHTGSPFESKKQSKEGKKRSQKRSSPFFSAKENFFFFLFSNEKRKEKEIEEGTEK